MPTLNERGSGIHMPENDQNDAIVNAEAGNHHGNQEYAAGSHNFPAKGNAGGLMKTLLAPRYVMVWVCKFTNRKVIV